MRDTGAGNSLRRTLNLPWLVFYGVGVTIGAGIFALIGQIVAIAGDHAALAFLVAGFVAAFTGFSYAALASAYPRAAGEAVFVKIGFGHFAGKLIGLGVVAVAITSTAVIALAFAGYVGAVTGLPESVSLIGVLVFLSAVAWAGVRESVGFAALITILEVATLIVVTIAGLPLLAEPGVALRVLSLPSGAVAWSSVFAGAFVAFFAFIGFEDIENMAEETHNPHRAIPQAIILTLVISVAIYVLVAMVAAAFPDRAALTASKAPLALLFERITFYPAAPIAVMASIAMINGILVQIVMASRVLYGMAREGMLPAAIGVLDPKRQTPVRAIVLVAALACLLALLLPLLQLAELTSLVMLLIFATVNLSLFLIGRREGSAPVLKRWRFWGLAGAAVSLALIMAELLG